MTKNYVRAKKRKRVEKHKREGYDILKKQQTNHGLAGKVSGLVLLFVFIIIMTPHDRAFASDTNAFTDTDIEIKAAVSFSEAIGGSAYYLALTMDDTGRSFAGDDNSLGRTDDTGQADTDRGGRASLSEPEAASEFGTDNTPESLFVPETTVLDEGLGDILDEDLGDILDEGLGVVPDEALEYTGGLDLSETAANIDEYSDVTVSNAVTGKYADMTKAFMFTVYFKDSSGTDYSEGEVVECGESAFILAEGGKAEFFLTDGQNVTFKELPADANIQIVQTTASGYKVSYKDSKNENYVPENHTELTIVGTGSRSFDFENNRTTITPVGINAGSETLGAAMLLILSTVLSGVIGAGIAWRKRCRL